MQLDDLSFKWDPNAPADPPDEKREPDKPVHLEDYFDFLEQFDFHGSDEDYTRHRVDKRFRLP